MAQLSHVVDLLSDGELIDRVRTEDGSQIDPDGHVLFTPKCKHCDMAVTVEVLPSILPESIDIQCFVNRHRVSIVHERWL